ncbi:Putative raf-like serine threonine-protein kinase phl-like protein [Halyomorpha halys]|nr:Putative raf-like serine threonine-protein kinase phl-like protein [Halyomorpha halys]
MSSEYDEIEILEDELKNIQSVIHLTRENIDALNAKFAGMQHPPPMYLSEYQELTSKLHELEVKEQQLNEQINLRLIPQDLSDSDHSAYPSLDRGHRPSFQTSLKRVVRAHLPNQQRTSVQVTPGHTVREALAKAMKLRNLTAEMCTVYSNNNNIVIPWDADISSIDTDEIRVEIIDNFPVTSISHNFVRKTFFSLVFCECCRRLLFQGFYCRTCGYRFHQRCAGGVPALCQQVRMIDNFYQMLLASNPEKSAGILHMPQGYTMSRPSTRRHPRALGHGERSSSAPNVVGNLLYYILFKRQGIRAQRLKPFVLNMGANPYNLIIE